MPDKNIYTIPQAAEVCSVSRGTVWRWVKTGKLRAAVTAGGHHRIMKDDLFEFTQLRNFAPPATESTDTKRILIVDDDPKIIKLLKRVLSGKGYELEHASDGFEAGLKLRKFNPHLVILDLIMPAMDGFDVCSYLKKNPDTEKIKIVAISGFDTEDNRHRILNCGADLFLPKPLDIQKIKKEIERLLQFSTPGTLSPN